MDKKLLEKFGTTPLEEPEIYDIFVRNGEDALEASEELLDYLEERLGDGVTVDFETIGAVLNRVLSKKKEDGTYKTTPKLETVEPLKPRDLIAFMRFMEKDSPSVDEAIDWLKERTNVPDELHDWEKVVLVETMLQYGIDGMKTVVGGALGN